MGEGENDPTLSIKLKTVVGCREGGREEGRTEETVSPYRAVNPSYDINSRCQHKDRVPFLTPQKPLIVQFVH